MPKQSIFEMPFSRVYPMLVQKAERKGRMKAEVDAVITWLTGYPDPEAASGVSCLEFYANAPAWNPNAEKITGTVCGVRVEAVDDPLIIRIFHKTIEIVLWTAALAPQYASCKACVDPVLYIQIPRTPCGHQMHPHLVNQNINEYFDWILV